MTRRLFVRCGAADSRAALLLGDEIVAFWFGPARGDEALPRAPQPGEIYAGRVRSVSQPLGAAFVDIGAQRDALLPIRDLAVAEGAAVSVLVRRAAQQGKGAIVGLADARIEEGAAPARIGPRLDPAVEAWFWARGLGTVDLILVSDPATSSALSAAGAVAAIDPTAWTEAAAEATLQASFEREIVVSGGGRMIIDEAEALTAIDVDAAHAAGGAAAGKLNNRVNHAVAGRIFRELSRRGIGGRIVADFLPPSDSAARRRLSDALKMAAAGVFAGRFGRLAEDGLFDMTAPRRRLSLMEEATELTTDSSEVRPGRRFTLDWQAKAAIAALEDRLQRRPSARLALAVSSDIDRYLAADRPAWLQRVASRAGGRFDLRVDTGTKERRFDVVE